LISPLGEPSEDQFISDPMRRLSQGAKPPLVFWGRYDSISEAAFDA
jgi:hypothetical protein